MQYKDFYNKRMASEVSLEFIVPCTSSIWRKHLLHCEKLIHEDSKKLMGTSPLDNIPPVVMNLAELDSDDSEFEFVDELDSFI